MHKKGKGLPEPNSRGLTHGHIRIIRLARKNLRSGKHSSLFCCEEEEKV
jgi:hypothetical protein